MKQNLVIGWALIALLALAACNNPAADSPPSNNPDKGKVSNQPLYDDDGNEYKGTGKVVLKIWQANGNEDTKNIGTVTNGKMSFTIPDISSGNYSLYDFSQVGGQGITVTPTSAKGLMGGLSFIEDSSNDEYSLSFIKTVTDTDTAYKYDSMSYYYVDRDVTIKGTSTSSYDDDGDTYTSTETWSNVSLKKGWNAIYSTHSETYSNNSSTSTHSTTEIKDLKWKMYLR